MAFEAVEALVKAAVRTATRPMAAKATKVSDAATVDVMVGRTMA
jgi:hypothetical protein